MPNARRFPPPWRSREATPASLSAARTARVRQQDHFSDNFRDDGCSVDDMAVCRRLSDKRNGSEFGMPAVKTVKIIAALLVGFFLSVPHAALAQGLFEANDLNQQVNQLYNQGRNSEATTCSARANDPRKSTRS